MPVQGGLSFVFLLAMIMIRARYSPKEILKNAEWILPFGTGVSYCLPPRQARPFHGEIRPSDLSFPWPFQHRGRLFLLSARSGEQSLFDNHQIGQRKQGM